LKSGEERRKQIDNVIKVMKNFWNK